MQKLDADRIHQSLLAHYAGIATGKLTCCTQTHSEQNVRIDFPDGLGGYSSDELRSAPSATELGLGYGNTAAMACIQLGDTVVDLGCGAGFDCFLAAKIVGTNGCVIGIDMTPEMIDRARSSAAKGCCENVEFRTGKIEHLPVADSCANVLISNCVINLSPDRARVFREAYRVLKPGGRLAISDIVATRPLAAEFFKRLSFYPLCAGCPLPATATEFKDLIEDAGFQDVRFSTDNGNREETGPVIFATIFATKPALAVRRGTTSSFAKRLWTEGSGQSSGGFAKILHQRF